MRILFGRPQAIANATHTEFSNDLDGDDSVAPVLNVMGCSGGNLPTVRMMPAPK